jgi:uncharacterized protein involved in exopolysaccharide biosynthesis
MDVTTALAALRRGWIFPLVGLLAAMAVTAAVQRNQAPSYETSGTYLVVPSPSDPNIIENIKTLDATRSRTILTTLTEIMTSDTVVSAAGAVAGVDPARYRVTAAALAEANGVTLRVTGPDPAATSAMANAVAAASAERFVALYRIYEVSVLDPPVSPAGPAGRGLFDLLALAGTLGLVVGGSLALMRATPRDRRRSTVSSRIEAYGGNVTPLRDHDRIQRVG